LTAFQKWFFGNLQPHLLGNHLAFLFIQIFPHDGRFLFAEYFDKRIIYQLLGYLSRMNFSHFKIYIVVEDRHRILEIQDDLKLCSSVTSLSTRSVIFENLRLDDFFADIDEKFDYIEYNCGVSVDPDYMIHLHLITESLSDDGIIGTILLLLIFFLSAVPGVTYFAANFHVDNIRAQLQQRLSNFFVPFSLTRKSFILQYLEIHGMKFMTDDQQLLRLLGAELNEGLIPKTLTELSAVIKAKAFKKTEIIELFGSLNLTILSWIPTAYLNPFGMSLFLLVCHFSFLLIDEVRHFAVQKWQTMGITEENFLYSYFHNFRGVVYLARKSPSKRGLQRFRMDTIHKLRDDIILHDRTGNVAKIFGELQEKAKSGSPGSFSINPFFLNGVFTFDFTVTVPVAYVLPFLSEGVSPSLLFKYARDFIENRHFNYNLQNLELDLLSVLKTMESINTLTVFRSIPVSDGLLPDSLIKLFKSIPVRSPFSLLVLGNCVPSVVKFFRDVFSDEVAVVCISSLASSFFSISGIIYITSLEDYFLMNLPPIAVVYVTSFHEEISQCWGEFRKRLVAGSILTFRSPDPRYQSIDRLLETFEYEMLVHSDHAEIQTARIIREKGLTKLGTTDIQVERMAQLGFDHSFISQFSDDEEDPADIRSANDDNTKHSPGSNLKELLKLLKEKTSKLSDQTALVNPENDVFHQRENFELLKNHSEIASDIPFSFNVHSPVPFYRRLECWG
jgi:hypothetical protein